MFSFMCDSEYRRMWTNDFWISSIQPKGDVGGVHPCCVYSIRRNTDQSLMSSGSSCDNHYNVMHNFPGP